MWEREGKSVENQTFASSRGVGSFKRTTRRSARRTEKNAMFAVLRGVLVAAAITVIGVAVFALILNWWNASDRAITAVNQVVKFVGLLYMALGIVCYALMMGQSPRLTAYLADLGMGLAAGGLFGMILTARKTG